MELLLLMLMLMPIRNGVVVVVLQADTLSLKLAEVPLLATGSKLRPFTSYSSYCTAHEASVARFAALPIEVIVAVHLLFCLFFFKC